MVRSARSLLKLTTAVVAFALPGGIVGAQAQSSGFAVELSPATDYYQSLRASVRVFGPAVEPASAYVRGCQGHVLGEGNAAVFDVTDRLEMLAFTAAGEGLAGMVLGTPDGLYRCALTEDSGLSSTQFSNVQPGRYLIWLAAAEEGAEVDGRIIASDRPVSALELYGLDVERLGEPRAGQHVFSASVETGRQQLASGATLYPESEMRNLNREYCPGYGRFDAADAVLTLDAEERQMSVFAMSSRDLTIAVRGPDGRVLCNDDSYGLNPAVTFENAPAGDYQVFVGAFSQGGSATFDLFASQGAPAFVDATFDENAAPRVGHAVLDASAAAGQLLATAPITATDPMEMLPTGSYCAGHTGIDAPDMVVTLDQNAPQLSLYAMSDTDLTIAVRGPDGGWMCNDDSFGLNPAVTFQNAGAGDYMVYVGAYWQGANDTFSLYAALGQPDWSNAGGGTAPGAAALAPEAEPAVGTVSFGPDTRVDPRVIFDIPASGNEAFGLGDGCAGYIDPSRPDVTISAAEGLPQLMVYMVSEADGTLVVVGPDGQIHCNDDFEGLNPGVMIPNPEAGDYAVFAGSYGGSGGLATLGVTIASPQWVMDREH